MTNEMSEEQLPGPFSEVHIDRLKASGREAGVSERYRATDAELLILCKVVNTIKDRYGFALDDLTLENTVRRHGEGRRIARQLQTYVSAKAGWQAEVDKTITLMLVRQAFQYERFEVVFKAVLERIEEWESDT
jgi:hypothetical protein